MNKMCYSTLTKPLFILVIAASFNANNSFAQCEANAGSDTTVCALGNITLSGTTNTSPSAPVVDIDQNQNNTCMANFSQGDLAQQFTATSSAICGAGLTFSSVASGSLTIALYTALPNAGGTQLATATGTVSNSDVGNVYWPMVTITPGTQYYLVFTTPSNQPISACVAGSTTNPYAGGMLYASAGFNPFPSFDYTFRTFTCAPAANITWTGPNIVSGANTTNPVVNPPYGQHTYTMTVVDPSDNCTDSDQVIVSRGQNSVSQLVVNNIGPYTWNGITYTESGQYIQVLQNSNGCDSIVSIVLNIGYVGLEDLQTNQATLFPNPTNDLLAIEFNAPAAQIEILDAQGKLIQTSSLVSGEQISLKNQMNGVYFVRITTENATSVHRIVKQ